MKPSVPALIVATCLLATNARALNAETCASAAERAQPLRRAGKLGDARHELRTCAAAECPAVVRNECVSWLRQVEEALPTIVVRASSEGKDEADVSVSVDGRLVAPSLDGRPIALDPGVHEMRYELKGFPPLNERVVLVAGEKNRVLLARFARPPQKREEQQQGPPPLVFWLGALGVASIGAGTVFYALGLGERSDMSLTCAPQHACSDSRIHAAQAKLVVGDVLVGLGIVSLAAAVYVYLTAPRNSHLDVRAFSTWK